MTSDQPRQDSLYLYCIMARFNPGLELRLDDRGPCNAANGYAEYRFSESLSKTRRLVVGVPWLRLEGRSLCTWKRSPSNHRWPWPPGQTGSSEIISRENDESERRLIASHHRYLAVNTLCKISLLNRTTSRHIFFFLLSQNEFVIRKLLKIRLVYIYVYRCAIYRNTKFTKKSLKRLEFEDSETIHKTLTTSLPTSHPNRRTSVSHSRLKGVEMKGKAVVERIRANRTKRKS